MTNKSIKKIAHNFTIKHHLIDIDFSSLKNVAECIGYTLIEFNAVSNDADIDTVIKNLHIGDSILNSRGFTYTDNAYRLIFINENLSEDEKVLVLSHELGHIACEHFTTSPIIGNDVKEEHEANEFAHYLLKQSASFKIKKWAIKNKKALIISTIFLIFIAVSVIIWLGVSKEQAYYGEYYITTTGNKYHEKDCIFVKDKTTASRLSEEAFESGEYEPCDMCLPD